MESDYAALQESLDVMTKERDEYKSASSDSAEKENLIKEMQELQDLITQREQELESLSIEYDGVNQDFIALQSQYEEILNEKESSGRNLEKLDLEFQQATSNFEKELKELQDQYDDSQTWANMVSLERDRLSEQIKELLEYKELQMQKVDLNEYENKVQTLEKAEQTDLFNPVCFYIYKRRLKS